MYSCNMPVICSLCLKGHMGSSFSLGKLFCSSFKEPSKGLLQCVFSVCHHPPTPHDHLCWWVWYVKDKRLVKLGK